MIPAVFKYCPEIINNAKYCPVILINQLFAVKATFLLCTIWRLESSQLPTISCDLNSDLNLLTPYA